MSKLVRGVEYYSVAEVARMTNLNRRTCVRAIEIGTLKARRFGSRTRYCRIEEVNEWLAAGSGLTTARPADKQRRAV